VEQASQSPTSAKPAPPQSVCPSCGQPLPSEDRRKRRRFYWGLALAWLPFLPILVGLVNAFRGISEQKATGVGAVAGGFAHVAVTYFVILAPVCLIAAFVLLVRSFSRAHPVRIFVATVSLCWTVLIGAWLTLFYWLAFRARW
jgi:hypothetical protein